MKWKCIFITLIYFYFSAASALTAAFFYNTNPPTELFSFYDIVVVQPYAGLNPADYKNKNLYAYVSLGEFNQKNKSSKEIKSDWIIGKNKTWHSDVMDASNPAWQAYFIHQIVAPLIKLGYHGIFFDTVDSYLLAAKTDAAREKQINGLASIILQIHQQFPDVRFILNRGFEVLPKVKNIVSAFVAESLYKSWDEQSQKYKDVSEKEKNILLAELKKVQADNIPIIIIDYMPISEKQNYLNDANKISADGFIPWVTDHDLNAIGVGDSVILPRRIILIHTDENNDDPYGESSEAFKYLAMPLEYLGYVPTLFRANQALPPGNLTGHYAGVVVWVDASAEKYSQSLREWLVKQKENNIPIAFINDFPFSINSNTAKDFGVIEKEVAPGYGGINISVQSSEMGYETKPQTGAILPGFDVEHPTKILMQISGKNNDKRNVIALTPWGGYALSGYAYLNDVNREVRWNINPITFFQEIFQPNLMPTPDVTTENGDRLMLAQIDGDGFVNRAQFDPDQFASEVIQKQILEYYKIPTSVSVIEGEIRFTGLYPALSPEAKNIARSIFQDPTVEIASHTYSHPFDWRMLEIGKKTSAHTIYNLPIKNYIFNIQREIAGSVDYINERLAPKDKKVKDFFWSGSADPSAKAVGLTYQLNLANINGGQTNISERFPSLTHISPLGIYKDQYFQTYAPIGNEIYYTNGWQGPYYGYENVIQTLKMTNAPLRLKPIDIYYHFFSGERSASLSALKKVYDWALLQSVMNIYVSQYVHKVLDYNQMIIGKTTTGWVIKNNGSLRELRIDKKMGFPDLLKSQNIIGFSDYLNTRYIHLGADTQSNLVFTSTAPTIAYLSNSNARIESWEWKNNFKTIDFTVQSDMPIEINISNRQTCKLFSLLNNKNQQEIIISADSAYHISKPGRYSFEIKCT